MSWYSKEQSTTFDTNTPEGFFYLDGDVLALALHQTLTQKQKIPMIAFPSGIECQIWESVNHTFGIVHLFGELDLPYKQSRDEAYKSAQFIADQIGYVVKKVGRDKLELHGYEDNEHLLVTYDNNIGHMKDIEFLRKAKERAKHPAHTLMNAEIQAKLPPLYTNEAKGLDAIAPVKYFHPTSQWTWYASEYDPKTKLFFGLVAGLEVELGSFSLEELEEVGQSGHTLPIERDLYYEPKTLREIQDIHRKLRGE